MAKKMSLTNQAVKALPFSDKGQYVVRDTDLKGFFIVVGKASKTYTVQVEAPGPYSGSQSIAKKP